MQRAKTPFMYTSILPMELSSRQACCSKGLYIDFPVIHYASLIWPYHDLDLQPIEHQTDMTLDNVANFDHNPWMFS